MKLAKVLIVGVLRLPPGALENARTAMGAMIAASRAEEGCVEYSYAEDVLEPGLIHVKELWESREALQRRLQSDHLRAWRSRWAALQISGRKLLCYEVGEGEPL
jgi:quinol monooxygenase YgiN